MTLCDNFKIDGVAIVAPDSEVAISRKDIESSDSGKDESGVLHRFLLRSKVRNWSFKYTHLTQEEYNYMENLLSGKESFSFSFVDENGATDSCTAYCPSASVAIRNIKTGIYSSYSFDVVEC